MPNTNDLLQAKLQKIYGALGRDAGITPPPDVKDTLGWWLEWHFYICGKINNHKARGYQIR
jgi:hypothetical protein